MALSRPHRDVRVWRDFVAQYKQTIMSHSGTSSSPLSPRSSSLSSLGRWLSSPRTVCRRCSFIWRVSLAEHTCRLREPHVRHLYWQRGALRQSLLSTAYRAPVACHLQHDKIRDPVSPLRRLPDFLLDARRARATDCSDRPHPSAPFAYGRAWPRCRDHRVGAHHTLYATCNKWSHLECS